MAAVALGGVSLTCGAGIAKGKAQGASSKQAIIFTATNFTGWLVLGSLWQVLNRESLSQFPLASLTTHLAIFAMSCLAGVLMTHFTCEKSIKWKHALPIALTSFLAAGIYLLIFRKSILIF